MNVPVLTFFTVAIGLAIDSLRPDLTGHIAANALVAVAWCATFRLANRAERRGLITCVILATAGEVFLCFVWGLYEYRHGNLPPFVPLGHSMIFLSGCRLIAQVPKSIWKGVVAVTAPLVIALAIRGDDTAGLLWYPMFLACLWSPRTRPLYGLMFLLALSVEIAGTQVHSWTWSPEVPWFSLTSTNPPLCAGVFYCVLDVLVLLTERAYERMQQIKTAP